MTGYHCVLPPIVATYPRSNPSAHPAIVRLKDTGTSWNAPTPASCSRLYDTLISDVQKTHIKYNIDPELFQLSVMD